MKIRTKFEETYSPSEVRLYVSLARLVAARYRTPLFEASRVRGLGLVFQVTFESNFDIY
jgi:hypothetical protein